jgi:hypothetical protein
MKAWLWIPVVALAAGTLFVGCGATRAGYETAPHRVLSSEGRFELREYPETRLVQTPMSQGEDGGFMRLFRFISGRNERQEKIAMTTPVFMERGHDGRSSSMAFVLPATLTNAPAPAQPDVTLASIAPGRFAVHRFSAPRPDTEREQGAEQALRAWINAQHLTAEGNPLFAYFDPPWIPRWFRRNEVMLRVSP